MAPRAVRRHRRRGESGFTLVEILAVMSIAALAFSTVSFLYKSPSASATVKSAAQLTASRLRDLRATAMSRGEERVAHIHPASRTLLFSDGRADLQLDPSIDITVTSAESQRATVQSAGVRFYPNGSSSGATIIFRSGRHAYEIRVNWLTGRVSGGAL